MTPTRTLTAHCTLSQDGLPLLTIDNEHARAEISLFGAHVLRYQRHGEPASLWLSDKAILDGSKPIRGGIPLCWPWFGPSPLALAAASRLMASHATACGRWMGSPITGMAHSSTSPCVTTMPAGHSGPMPSSWSWTYWSARSFPWC